MHTSVSHANRARQWDIFCAVIDNFGDLGVCWRLACQAAARGETVRLWVDDPSALAWMAPDGADNVEVRAWGSGLLPDEAHTDVLIEAFGCAIDSAFIAQCVRRCATGALPPAWINLEYLSAERYIGRCHGLTSPVLQGPASGWSKRFFYPSFSNKGGGLLREPDLGKRQTSFDRMAWRAAHASTEVKPGSRWVSLFCYEPTVLAQWLEQCAQSLSMPTHLMVTAGRAARAVEQSTLEISSKNMSQRLCDKRSQLSFLNLEPVSQIEFDEMLWACDLNFVRGEDSLVRALLAGKPLVWHIYAQDDGAHEPKLNAFLDWLEAPTSLRLFHHVWNGLSTQALPLVNDATLAEWAHCIRGARERVLGQSDLLTQLFSFCASQR